MPSTSRRLARRSATIGPLTLAVVLAMPGTGHSAPGDLDLGFGGSSHGRVTFDLGAVTGLAVQPNGGIVVVADSPDATGVQAKARRFTADGRRDGDFGTTTLPTGLGAVALATAAVSQPDGRVIVVGTVPDAGGSNDIAVWRITRSGALDTSFGGDGLVQLGTAGSDTASDVALDAQGRTVVVGTSDNGDPDIAAARLTPGGAPDPTFNAGRMLVLPNPGLDSAGAVALQSDGQIVVGGLDHGIQGNAVLRITPGDAATPAALDKSFGGGDGVADVAGAIPTNSPDVAITSNGNILVLEAEASTSGALGDIDASVVQLDGAGVVDKVFGAADGTGARIAVPDVNTVAASALTVMPNGGVVVAGAVLDAGQRAFVAKFRSSGRPDVRMGTGGVRMLRADEGLAAVTALVDGRIVATGNVGADGVHNVLYRLRGDLRAPLCGGTKATIVGTRASDRLVGTRHPDVIAGLGSGDTITGLGKDDVICGGRGSDHLLGGRGNDRLIGGPGRDSLRGGPGRDLETP